MGFSRALRYAAAASAFALAGPAVGQSSTTTCETVFGITTCNTRPQPQSGINWGIVNQQPAPNPGNAFMDGYVRGQQLRAAEEERLARRRAEADAASAKALGVAAGKLVAAGDCDGALKLALDAGDLDLAGSVKDYCSK